MMDGRASQLEKKIVLCADDFGYTTGISEAIADLLAKGRISATSCMTVMPDWTANAHLISALHETVDIGLHFTLTDEKPLTNALSLSQDGRFLTFSALMAKAFLGRLDYAAVMNELEAQVAAFTSVMLQAPDFIDGHQYVHQLPLIRNVVSEYCRREGFDNNRFYVRNSAAPIRSILSCGVNPGRALMIGSLGSTFRTIATTYGLKTNNGFSGIHDFRLKKPYRRLFKRFLKGVENGALIVCHPGHGESLFDPIAKARKKEFAYITSEHFTEDLAAGNIRLGRFCDAFLGAEHDLT